MNDYLKLAWRNIWRNKRRTIICAASVFFGVVLSSFMSSMQEGSYEMYINTIVNFYSGYIQVHKKGYWDDKIINNTLDYTSIQKKIPSNKGVSTITPRLENFALASLEDLTKGVMVIGISPEKENSITNLSKRVSSGNYLREGDKGVIVGSALAKYMKAGINDTLVLLSQGYHGVSAAGKYPVRGIIKQPSPDLDKSVVYMDLSTAQEFFTAQQRLTSLVIMVKDVKDVPRIKREFELALGSNYEVMDWKEMNSMLIKQIDSDRASGLIMKGVLYIIIAFGIFGTILMMTAERRKEFGVVTAIGMHKSRLSCILILETILLGFVGIFSGIAASIPLTLYFKFHPIPLTGQAAETMLLMGFEPIMPFSMTPSVYYNQAIAIFTFTILIGLYPVFIISRMKISKALYS